MNLRWHLSSWLVKVAIWLLKLSGWYEGYWNHWRAMFAYAQKKGLHIMPVHYYSPIPDTRDLPDLWKDDRTPVGFDLKIEAALGWLDQLRQKYGEEYKAFPKETSDDHHSYHLNNDAYRSGDAEVLYAILRDLKPRRIVEIGAGYSTLLMCQAIRANRRETPGYQCDFVAVEPYPPAMLRPPPPEVRRIDTRPIQQITGELFLALGANDVLFIDSSHVARIGSDVVHEYLSIVPNLAPGVVVHIHDIFTPSEYPRWWIDEARFFWNEQYVVEAFLTHNRKFEVIMPTHAIWRLHPERFRKAIPSIETGQHAPSSFWIRRHSD